MIQTQLPKQRRERFDGYIEYSMSDRFISYVTVQDQRLYFPKYDNKVTIADLSQQYSLIHKGKELNLETDLFKIDPTTPLAQITSTPQKIEVLEKVLTSCKDHKNPLTDIKKAEEIKIAEDLVCFVKKHNQKIQSIKDFQSHDCLIKVKHRPQFAPEFNYYVVETTTMNEIAQIINKKAGNMVQLVSVQLGNGVAYSSSSLLNKPFSELRMNSKQITLIYPQILTLNNSNKFKIKLTNSPYIHDIVQLNVKKQDTIQVLVKAIKKIIDLQDDPLQIRDSQGNPIDLEKWKNPISSFIYRKLQFQFLYPTFLNYECEILVTNFPGKTFKLKYLVHKNTTFTHMIKYINENIHCQNAYFRIMDSKGKVYGPQTRNKTLFSLKIQEQVFRFIYLKPSCMIRANTNVIVKSRKGQLEQMTVKELVQSQEIKQLQIMTYNEGKHQMDYGHVTCFKKESGFSILVRITLAGDEDIINLQCFADSTFKTQNFVWKPARMLEKGEKIMMSRSDLQNVHYAEVLAVKQIGIEGDEQLLTLQVFPHHNFLANGVILHNDESYTFDVNFYQANKPSRKQTLRCYLNEKLSEVKAFKGKKLMMGGLALKNSLTFGDYQVYNFGTIFAFDQSYSQTSQDFIISAWREQSYKDKDVDHMLRDKWSSDFWGMHKSKIVEIKKDIQTMKTSKTPQQLLVCPKMHLKKLNYLYNIAPQYKPYEQEIMSSRFRPMVWEEFFFREQLQQLMQNKDDFLRSEKDILPLYMYTTNLVYQQLNSFLRMPQHPKNNAQELQQMKKWYTFTNRLISSLDKLPSVEFTTLYRGMRNVSISDAFGAKNQSITKDSDKYLILQSFTSTTKTKEVAMGFIAGRGALMTIKSHSGKSISNYSQYKEQDQVLLPPFLYFKITRLQENVEGIDYIDLQEIPFPRTDKKKLVFWVDDIPAGNRSIIENQLQPQGIEVVQVMSTSIMKIILKDFFGILQALGKQIVIISDMGRYQDGAWNCEAGVDLFNLIYKQYGMSNKAIIFTMDQKRARNAIGQRGINQSNWTVLVDSDRVVAQVMAQFNR